MTKTDAAPAASYHTLLLVLLAVLSALLLHLAQTTEDSPTPVPAVSSQAHHGATFPGTPQVYSTFPVRQRCVPAWQATVLHRWERRTAKHYTV